MAIIIFIALNSNEIFSQRLLPNANALTSTFNIFTDSLSGTCFTTVYDNEEFVVTAKHLFKTGKKSKDSVTVKINVNTKITEYKGQIILHPDPKIDLAVIKLPVTISQRPVLPFGSAETYFMGQDCLFLGYPIFSLGSTTKFHKIPFIKGALISATITDNGIDYLLLDGHNNVGFSGGPVMTYTDKMDNQFIFAVIGGYLTQSQKVKTNIPNYSAEVNENSGIIIAYPVKYITEIFYNMNN